MLLTTYYVIFDSTNTANMKANSPEHKQYLITSIAEMELFVDKCIAKLYTGEISTEVGAKAIAGVIDRKQANINHFKELLRTKYNHIA